jgi:hypothetical protein
MTKMAAGENDGEQKSKPESIFIAISADIVQTTT